VTITSITPFLIVCINYVTKLNVADLVTTYLQYSCFRKTRGTAVQMTRTHLCCTARQAPMLYRRRKSGTSETLLCCSARQAPMLYIRIKSGTSENLFYCTEGQTTKPYRRRVIHLRPCCNVLQNRHQSRTERKKE
jgi:hypothetical protein